MTRLSSIKIQNNNDLIDELKDFSAFKHKPTTIDSTKFTTCELIGRQTPKESARYAIRNMTAGKLIDSINAPILLSGEFDYEGFVGLDSPYSFHYKEGQPYTQWKPFGSHFRKTNSRDAIVMITEIQNIAKMLKASKSTKPNSQGCANCEDPLFFLRDDSVIRDTKSEQFIGLHELARMVDGSINANDILDPQTVFFIDGGTKAKTLLVPNKGEWSIDMDRLAFKFNPFEGWDGVLPELKYEARKYESREIVKGSLNYNPFRYPVTVDVLNNDGNVLRNSIQLLDPRTNRPSFNFAVKGEGVWYIDNYNFVVFEPYDELDKNPTPIWYAVKNCEGDDLCPAKIEIKFMRNVNSD